MTNLPKVKRLYMIRRKSDGLYSTGGSSPRFTRVGKAWTAINHLKNHLKLVGVGHAIYDDKWNRIGYNWSCPKYADCEIVVFEVVKTESSILSIDDIIEDMRHKAEEV